VSLEPTVPEPPFGPKVTATVRIDGEEYKLVQPGSGNGGWWKSEMI